MGNAFIMLGCAMFGIPMFIMLLIAGRRHGYPNVHPAQRRLVNRARHYRRRHRRCDDTGGRIATLTLISPAPHAPAPCTDAPPPLPH